jgi:hypothetical protein
MADDHHINRPRGIFEFLDNPIGADSNPPTVGEAAKLPGTLRSGVASKVFDPGENPLSSELIESLQLLPGRSREGN